MNTAKLTPKQIAKEFVQVCEDKGWDWSVKDSGLVTIRKKIDTSSNDDFVKADMEYYGILTTIPQTTPGSIWGTDGGGVGALSAMRTGWFEMKMSGGNKRVTNHLLNLTF